MRGDEFTGRIGAKAVDDVIDACRDADGVHAFAKKRRRGGRFFGRLDDNRIAAGKRRRDLPGHQQEGHVPRADHADDTDRAAQRIIDRTGAVRGRGLEEFRRHRLHDVGEDLEVCSPARDGNMADQVQRNTGILLFGNREILEATRDLVSKRIEQLKPLLDRVLAPRPLQGSLGGGDSGIDLGLAGLGDLTDHLVVVGRALVEMLVGVDVPTVDEILENLGHGSVLQ